MSHYRNTFSAEAEAILARARAIRGIRHTVVKGDVVEKLFKDFLNSVLPDRYQVSSGILIGSESETSGQVDILIHDRTTASFPGSTNTIGAESVWATAEVKMKLERRHLLKAADDASIIKNLRRTVPCLGLATAKNSTIQGVSFQIPPLTQCSIISLSSRTRLKNIAEFWHHHFLDVTFGSNIDGILVLDEGHVGLGSWLPQTDSPTNFISPLYNLMPGEDDDEGALLLFPDIFSEDWSTECPIRFGPRVPLAIGSRLYITVNLCGLDALGVWFRILYGFLAGQIRSIGEYVPESLGGLEEAFPSQKIDIVLPLAIAVKPDTLPTDDEYVLEMVGRLLAHSG